MIMKAEDIRISFRKERQLFRRERQEILHGVSLNLKQGECLGLVGESGSGKSTLAKVLCGLNRPDSGSVEIGGLSLYGGDRQERQSLRHEIGIVFQEYTSSVNPYFHIETVIEESLRACGKTKKRKSEWDDLIDSLLTRVGLPLSYRKKYPHELSGGELQRVCIARTLALEPRIIVFDEAVSSLDGATQVIVMDLLNEIQKDLGLSYIFITHDLTTITYMCDRVTFLKDGLVVEELENLDELKDLKNPYARKLIESVLCLDA